MKDWGLKEGIVHRVIPRSEKDGEGGNEKRARREQVEVGFEVRWER